MIRHLTLDHEVARTLEIIPLETPSQAPFRHRQKPETRGVLHPALFMVDDTGLEPVTSGM